MGRISRVAWLVLATSCAGAEGGRGGGTEGETLGDGSGGSGGGGTGASSSTTTGSEACGNGMIEGAEECDDGLQNGNDAACTPACRAAACGDGLIQAGVEQCDDGDPDDTNACTTLCQPPACDDGIVSGDETDVDCGGSCSACVAGEMCLADTDCENQLCTVGICAPAGSCLELLAQHPSLPDGLYTIDPNGGGAEDAIEVLCDMSTDGGGWTAIVANGDISVAETSDPTDCYPLISGQAADGCGQPNDLMSDFSVSGGQQAGLSWRYLLAVAYGDGGYSEKLAFFAIDYGGEQPTAEERFNGINYVPVGITTQFGQIACTGGNIVHYTRAGTYTPPAARIADGKGTVFGHDTVITMNSSARLTFGFTDASNGGGTASGVGVDDYQDGWSCGDAWAPQQIRGARMVVLVR